MGIERWAVSNTQFAPKADGMWVRHEDHEAALEEQASRGMTADLGAEKEMFEARAEVDALKKKLAAAVEVASELGLGRLADHQMRGYRDIAVAQRDEAQAAVEVARNAADVAEMNRDHWERECERARDEQAVSESRAVRANEGRTEAHAQRDAALAEIGAVKKEGERLSELCASYASNLNRVEKERDEARNIADRWRCVIGRMDEEREGARAVLGKALEERDVATLERDGASAHVARLMARLLHYEELMVERACEEKESPRACCDCRYGGDAHAHAVVCWACNNHSCWRPKLKPVERGCDSCRHWATVYCDPPCSLCEKLEWSRWEPKPEERRCSNCAHAMDEEMAPPCVDCKTTAIGWNPPTNWRPKT